MRAAVVALALVVVAACGSTQTPATATTALITFDANVKDAEVWIDGSFYAGALERGIKVAPGGHRIEIRHDEYHTQYLELDLTAGEHRTVEVRLAEILP